MRMNHTYTHSQPYCTQMQMQWKLSFMWKVTIVNQPNGMKSSVWKVLAVLNSFETSNFQLKTIRKRTDNAQNPTYKLWNDYICHFWHSIEWLAIISGEEVVLMVVVAAVASTVGAGGNSWWIEWMVYSNHSFYCNNSNKKSKRPHHSNKCHMKTNPVMLTTK